MLPSICSSDVPDTRCQIKDPPLWQSSGDQCINVTVGVPDGFQATGYAETIKESRNSFVKVWAKLVI